MQKRDTTTAVPRSWGFVDQAHARGLEPSEVRIDVLDLEGDVVNAARPRIPASPGEKLGNRRFFRGGRDQLDAAGIHRGLDFLGRDYLAIRLLAQNKVPDAARLGQIADGDPNMINSFHAADYEESHQSPEPTAANGV